MADYSRKLLDELMGLDRNKSIHEERSREKRFFDKDVCKYFLVSFCPHELFPNTKADIGLCEYRVHDEALRADYMLNGEEYIEQYEKKLMDFLQRLINDLDRKIKRAKERLQAKPSDEILSMMKPNKDENEEKIVRLELQLKDILERMEKFGEEGKIVEAQQLDCEADRIKKDIDRIKQMEKEMETCNVCGAFLVINDVAKRLDAHYEGKQHVGFDRVRKELERLRAKYPLVPTIPNERPSYPYEIPSPSTKLQNSRSRSPSTFNRETWSKDSRIRSRSPPYRGARQSNRFHKSRSRSPIPNNNRRERRY